MLNIVLIAFILATAFQVYCWLFLFRKLALQEDEKEETKNEVKQKKVSVIICARNEAENLKKNLPRILSQNYRSFEVVVVNDNSTDDTENILLDFIINNPILCVVNLREKPAGIIGKKYALAQGIAAAKNELLLLTDADCCPTSKNWIQKMQAAIKGPVEIGLAYGPYYTYSGFLNKFIRYETIHTATLYLSLALAGKPYMGVGRNLIYKKSLFEKVGGFKDHETIASGDDDLFINAAARADNTLVITDSDTFMYSEPKRSWKSFFRQKSRHLSTGKHYTNQNKLILGLISLSHFIHFVGGLILIVKFSTIFVIVLYVVRISSLMWTSRPLYSKLNSPSLWKWIPVLDAAFLFYYLVFMPALITGNTNQWK